MKSNLFNKSSLDKETKQKNMLYFETLKKEVIKSVEKKNNDLFFDSRKNKG